MVAPRIACDTSLLHRVVRGLAVHTEVQELETHLGDCVHCQQLLQSLAGGHEFALTARTMLPPNEWQNGVESSNTNLPELSFLKPSDDSRYIGTFCNYRIESVLGYGGFGIVLKGWDPNLSRFVAIKVLASSFLHSATAKQRFAREARAAAAISHDAVVPIYAVESNGSVPYLVLGYVPGPSLDKYLEEHGPLEPIRVVRIAMQVAQGLDAAHSQGIVHRDVKPGNILLSGELDRIKITDFGLARVVDDASQSQSGMILGTPQYMSPEQARGEIVDQRSDLFSLGSVMYAMCCGHSPFRAETAYGILRRISDEEPRDIRQHNSAVPAELAGIIHRLLNKRAHDRFSSAKELAELLQSYLAFLQQPAGTTVSSPMLRELRQLAYRGSQENAALHFVRTKMTLLRFVVASAAMAVSLLCTLWVFNGLRESPTLTTSLRADESLTTQVPAQSRLDADNTSTSSTSSKQSVASATMQSLSEWDSEYKAALLDLNQLEASSPSKQSFSSNSLQSLVDEIHLHLNQIESPHRP